MTGLQALHNANYGHTDVRWENIIQCGSAYRLIDLEFACKLKQLPFTPKGQQVPCASLFGWIVCWFITYSQGQGVIAALDT